MQAGTNTWSVGIKAQCVGTFISGGCTKEQEIIITFFDIKTDLFRMFSLFQA
ncbi:MAG TPA: hypothetical protein PKC91_02310 [Ignavibacteria bacterium]|nr:hypothetical protein [Ignavibacteria bacterium]